MFAVSVLWSEKVKTEKKQTMIINAKTQYGLIGDGKADDTKALQQTFQCGKPVFIPEGRYRFTAPLEVSYNTKIIGAGSAKNGAWAGPLCKH